MDWLPIDERMPVYPQDTEDYPPILICTDKGKVFLVIPERDQKMGICNTIHYSNIWLEEKSEGTLIDWIARNSSKPGELTQKKNKKYRGSFAHAFAVLPTWYHWEMEDQEEDEDLD